MKNNNTSIRFIRHLLSKCKAICVATASTVQKLTTHIGFSTCKLYCTRLSVSVQAVFKKRVFAG